ncbi:MAG TPA: GTPase Era [Patescibacteria group bacterium]|nr:GTPase Era [Patescibacteria group bacterium]
MKTGLVVLIGRSNVGKSTLLNTLIGTKIAATSNKPQMTRHTIHGVLNRPEGQAVFVDTPGIFKDKASLLAGRLQEKIKSALADDINVIVYVADPTRPIGQEERATLGMIRKLPQPKILVINKSDLPAQEKTYESDYESLSPDFNCLFKLSALRASHIEPLRQKVFEFLPESEPLYFDQQLTNVDDYFWVGEIIREKIFDCFDKEVPYTTTVEVDDVEEKTGVTVITARILTSADRYKKIIIGRGGRKIKEIGQAARRELEQALNTKIYLDLEVEVDPHWPERV